MVRPACFDTETVENLLCQTVLSRRCVTIFFGVFTIIYHYFKQTTQIDIVNVLKKKRQNNDKKVKTTQL